MPLRSPQDYPNGDIKFRYCKNCADEKGELRSYFDIHRDMAQFLIRTQGMDREFAFRAAEKMLSDKPEWKKKEIQ